MSLRNAHVSSAASSSDGVGISPRFGRVLPLRRQLRSSSSQLQHRWSSRVVIPVCVALFLLLYQISWYTRVSTPQDPRLSGTAKTTVSGNRVTTSSRLASNLSPTITDATKAIPPCEVLVMSHMPFHYEVLESVMRQYPLTDYVLRESNQSRACDSTLLTFHFAINMTSPVGKEWAEYMKQEHGSKLYPFSLDTKQRRQLGWIRSTGRAGNTNHFIAKIQMNCYCSASWINFLKLSRHNFCVMHNTCPELAHNYTGQYYHLSPMQSQHFLPIHMPPTRHAKQDPPPIRLCSIGGTGRRNLQLLGRTLGTIQPPPNNQSLMVHILGSGQLPPGLRNRSEYVIQQAIPTFREYYDQVAQCHVILPLVEPKIRPAYFPGGEWEKLTGSVVQGVAYQIDMIMHRQLETIYHKYLTNITVDTYDDDDESFRKALEMVLQRKGYPWT